MRKLCFNFVLSRVFRGLQIPGLCALALIVSACGAPVKKKQAPPPAAVPSGPRLVGTIYQVKPEEGFVLVDVGAIYAQEAGKKLKCISGGVTTAELVATKERVISFISADIVSGTPTRGDQVFESSR